MFLRKSFLVFGSLALVVSLTVPTYSHAYEPIHSEKLLQAPAQETVVQVRTAKVVMADYGLLRRDFLELADLSEAAIDRWLLDKTAFISRPQAAQAAVNSLIELTGVTTEALRPLDYGRALVYRVGPNSFIDGKGAGTAVRPWQGGHSNGLATVGESIREFMYEKLVRTILTHSGSKIETVEHYGVIDWGFDVVHKDGSRDPAGMILRQAHERAGGMGSMFGETQSRSVEILLRRYGLTSAGAYRKGAVFEKINIQGTRDGALLDFGAYLGVESFDKPAKHFFGGRTLLEPGHIEFIQPAADIRVPFDVWGFTETGIGDPKFDNPWVWSHRLAKNLRSGVAGPGSTQVHYENMVGNYRRSLYKTAGETGSSAAVRLMKLLRGLR